MSINRAINIQRMLDVCHHLTASQLGIVMRLSAHMARTGVLPEKNAELCRIIGIPSSKWTDKCADAFLVVKTHAGFQVRVSDTLPYNGSKKYSHNNGVKNAPPQDGLKISESANKKTESDTEPSRAHLLLFNNNKESNNNTHENGSDVMQMPLRETTNAQVLAGAYPSQVEKLYMQYGVRNEDRERALSLWSEGSETTAFTDAKHMLNSFRLFLNGRWNDLKKKTEPVAAKSYKAPAPINQSATK